MKEALEQVVDLFRAPANVGCCCSGAAETSSWRMRRDGERLLTGDWGMSEISNKDLARRRGRFEAQDSAGGAPMETGTVTLPKIAEDWGDSPNGGK
jgi:hypothetical protein